MKNKQIFETIDFLGAKYGTGTKADYLAAKHPAFSKTI